MRKSILALLFFSILQVSCSSDDPAEDDTPKAQICEMETADEGCVVAYLEGQTGFIKIIKQGNLDDPRFMYPLGQTDEPYGTVTVFLEDGNPVVYLNDMVLNDYILTVSQSQDGSNSVCKVENNFETPETADESADVIEIDQQFTFPFYIKLESNVCF